MNLKERIDKDLKAALLAGEKNKAMTLRGLKSIILNAEIAAGKRETGLSEDELADVLLKETKKRQESADLYRQGGNTEKAEAELLEKSLIEEYLPEQVNEDEISEAVDQAIAGIDASGPKVMGQVIGKVKQEFGARADGVTIARIVKEKLQP